jgi:CBS domain-containing protein
MSVDTLRDVMVRRLIKVGPKDNLLQVQGLIQRFEVGRIIVADDSRPLGILTRKDMIRYLLEDTSDRDLDEIKANDVMTRDLVRLPESASIAEAARLMIEKGISSVIAVDPQGKLVGLVTKTDLCLYFGSRASPGHRVRDWMTPKPISVRGSASIFKVTALMQQQRISRVLVQNVKLEGIVTVSDLVTAGVVFNPKGPIEARKPIMMKGMMVKASNLPLLSARDVMTANPVTVDVDADLSSVAKLMSTHRISGVPVVDRKERLVGILTKTDIVKAIAKTS